MDKAQLQERLEAMKKTIKVLTMEIAALQTELSRSYEEDIVIVDEDFIDNQSAVANVLRVLPPPPIPQPSLTKQILADLAESLR